MPAPVQEQDRLFALTQPLVDPVDQFARQHVLALRVQHLPAHVHDPEGRHRPIVDALRHRIEHVAPRLRVPPRLQRRRRRAQHARRAQDRRAHHRHIAPVVHRRLALLEGRLVFLVDHDQPKVRQRREHRRTRAHHHPRLPQGHRHPRVETLARGQVAMPDDHLGAQVGQPRTQPPDRLGGQGDLGHQEDRRATLGDDLADERDVDLGLARARDSVEQVGLERLRIEGSRHRSHRRRLFGVERVAGGSDRFRLRERVVVGHAPEHARVLLDRARADQRVHRLLRDPETRDHLRAVGGLRLPGQIIQHLRLARRLAAQLGQRLRSRRLHQRQQTTQHRPDPFTHRRRQDRFQDRVEPAAVVTRHPFRELATIGRQDRLLVFEQDDAAQLGRRRGLRRVFPDHPETRAPA